MLSCIHVLRVCSQQKLIHEERHKYMYQPEKTTMFKPSGDVWLNTRHTFTSTWSVQITKLLFLSPNSRLLQPAGVRSDPIKIRNPPGIKIRYTPIHDGVQCLSSVLSRGLTAAENALLCDWFISCSVYLPFSLLQSTGIRNKAFDDYHGRNPVLQFSKERWY